MTVLTRPAKHPDWCLTGTMDEPPSGKRDVGWETDERPPHEYMNHLQGYGGLWTRYFDRAAEGVLALGVQSGLAVTFDATDTFAIGAGVYLDALGRKIGCGGTNELTIVPGDHDNGTGSNRIDAIVADGNAEHADAPSFKYIDDYPGTGAVAGEYPVAFVIVPNGAYSVGEILAAGKVETGQVRRIADGSVIADAENFVTLDAAILAVNLAGGGIVRLAGTRFVNLTINIKLRSGVVLEGSGVTFLHAASDQLAPMVSAAGLASATGSVSDDNLLTDPDVDFYNYGIGSIVVIGAATYYVSEIESATTCRIVRRNGTVPTLSGGVTYDLFVTGAGLSGLNIDGANLPIAAETDCIVHLEQTIGFRFRDVLVFNSAGVARPIQTGIFVKGSNLYLDAYNLDVSRVAGSMTNAWKVPTAGAGLNEYWRVFGNAADPVTLGSSGSGVAEFHGRFTGTPNSFLGAATGWYGPAENAEHNTDGTHSDNIIGKDQLRADVCGNGLTGGNGTALSVVGYAAEAVQVTANGVGLRYDTTYLRIELNNLTLAQQAAAKYIGAADSDVASTAEHRFNFATKVLDQPGADRVTTGVGAWNFQADRVMRVRVRAVFNATMIADPTNSSTPYIEAHLYHKDNAHAQQTHEHHIAFWPDGVMTAGTVACEGVFSLAVGDYIYATFYNGLGEVVRITGADSNITIQEEV